MLKLCWFILLCFIPIKVIAADFIEIGKIKTKQLEDIFNFYQYNGEKEYLMVSNYNYPPIFCKYFPDDFSSITDEKHRNAMFIKILAPLTLKLNNEIYTERQKLQQIASEFKKNHELTKEQEQNIENLASKYDVFTRLKGHRRYTYLIDELLQRIHVIPPSVLITAAALETNWGTSRIVKEANSLYKTLVWHTTEGLKPIGETEDDSYRIKKYPNIYSSLQEFALKINSSLAFKDFRDFRHQIMQRRMQFLGTVVTPYLVWNSPLKNYAGLFDYTLSYYELIIIDKSVLNSKMINKTLPKNLQKFIL